MRQQIKLTEEELQEVIAESVRMMLENEYDEGKIGQYARAGVDLARKAIRGGVNLVKNAWNGGEETVNTTNQPNGGNTNPQASNSNTNQPITNNNVSGNRRVPQLPPIQGSMDYGKYADAQHQLQSILKNFPNLKLRLTPMIQAFNMSITQYKQNSKNNKQQ